jgi:hypothetical protein
LGTALVYPTFLSAIAQTTNPHQELKALVHSDFGDLGYAIAQLFRITADLFE